MVAKQYFWGILSISFILLSCQVKKIYVSKGIDIYSQIELCKNKKFAMNISGMIKDDTIYGNWERKNDTIFIHYTDKIYHSNINLNDTVIQIKISHPQQGFHKDILKIYIHTIDSNKIFDSIPVFDVIVNDSFPCKVKKLTSNIELAECPNLNTIQTLKLEIKFSGFYAKWIINKSNLKEIHLTFTKPIKEYISNPLDNFLHFDPPIYFITKPFKLCEKDIKSNKLNCHYKRKFSSNIKLLECKK